MENPINPEVVSALEKIPTDAELVYKKVSEWEKAGDIAQLATINMLLMSKLLHTESAVESMARDMRLLRESLEDVRKVTTTRLAHKLQINPELREGFTRETTSKGDVVLKYKGSSKKCDMYEGYDQLHYKLTDVYGFKEVDYKTMNNALLKSFNWSQEEEKRWDEVEIAMAVLSKAEFLYTKHRSKKVTIPEIKKELPYSVDSKVIKKILLDAGWITLKQGSCKTLFFTQPEVTL